MYRLAEELGEPIEEYGSGNMISGRVVRRTEARNSSGSSSTLSEGQDQRSNTKNSSDSHASQQNTRKSTSAIAAERGGHVQYAASEELSKTSDSIQPETTTDDTPANNKLSTPTSSAVVYGQYSSDVGSPSEESGYGSASTPSLRSTDVGVVRSSSNASSSSSSVDQQSFRSSLASLLHLRSCVRNESEVQRKPVVDEDLSSLIVTPPMGFDEEPSESCEQTTTAPGTRNDISMGGSLPVLSESARTRTCRQAPPPPQRKQSSMTSSQSDACRPPNNDVKTTMSKRADDVVTTSRRRIADVENLGSSGADDDVFADGLTAAERKVRSRGDVFQSGSIPDITTSFSSTSVPDHTPPVEATIDFLTMAEQMRQEYIRRKSSVQHLPSVVDETEQKIANDTSLTHSGDVSGEMSRPINHVCKDEHEVVIESTDCVITPIYANAQPENPILQIDSSDVDGDELSSFARAIKIAATNRRTKSTVGESVADPAVVRQPSPAFGPSEMITRYKPSNWLRIDRSEVDAAPSAKEGADVEAVDSKRETTAARPFCSPSRSELVDMLTRMASKKSGVQSPPPPGDLYATNFALDGATVDDSLTDQQSPTPKVEDQIRWTATTSTSTTTKKKKQGPPTKAKRTVSAALSTPFEERNCFLVHSPPSEFERSSSLVNSQLNTPSAAQMLFSYPHPPVASLRPSSLFVDDILLSVNFEEKFNFQFFPPPPEFGNDTSCGHELVNPITPPDEFQSVHHPDDDFAARQSGENRSSSVELLHQRRFSNNHRPTPQSRTNDAGKTTIPVSDWSVEDVADWLDGLHMGDHRDGFARGAVDGVRLASLTRDALIELGVAKLKHRMTIERAICKLLKS